MLGGQALLSESGLLVLCEAEMYGVYCVHKNTTPEHMPREKHGLKGYSSVLAWRIPGTGEPGGLLSMGSHRVGHD